MLNRSISFVIIMLCLTSPLTSANQVQFNKTNMGEYTEFFYKWLDADGNEQTLDFKLNTRNVNSDFRHFKALTPAKLQMYSLKKLKQAIASMNPRDGSVKIRPNYQGVEFEFKSTSQQWMQQKSTELKRVYELSLKQYLKQEYYIEFEPIGYPNHSTTTYKPDHVRFAAESATSLSPLVEKLKQRFPRANARYMSRFLLSWLQTIPYSTLESRAESNGAGFSPPIQLISNNRGDCDSKVTLMASILKALYPRLQVAIVYVPDHALIGLNVSHLVTDDRLQIDELDYTLSEPTGPGLLKFAEISERSKRFIESGIYQTEVF